MTDAFDTLSDELAEGPLHPVIGQEEAAVPAFGPPPVTAAEKRRARIEFPAYLMVQASWFAGFGLQMVLFSFLATQVLKVSSELLGLAQMSLTAPSMFLILFGGVLAERADGRFLLLSLHILACAPPLALGYCVGQPSFAYWMMITYALAMGTIGAFMMPARDAILNEVIYRRQAAGSRMTIQQGVAIASLVQFAAQLLGLLAGGHATKNSVWILLIAQSVILALGGVGALFLCPSARLPRSDGARQGVFRAIGASLLEVFRSPVIGPMILSTFGIGVFVIGSFLVVLPIFTRDIYHGGAGFLATIFVLFWLGAFVSALAMTRFRHLTRPGAVMLIAQGLGALCMLGLTRKLAPDVFFTLCFVWGLVAGVAITLSRALVQSAAPKAHLARVLSVYQLGFVGGAPIGAVIMGLATHRMGAFAAPWIPAIGLFSIVLILAFLTPIGRLRGS